MTDRDTFAAAALTGLLSNVQRYQNEPLTRQAFEIADFMLRERERTNLDAAPAAIANAESVAPQPTTRGESDRTDKAAPRHSEGTGDTPKPIKGGVSDRPTPITGPDPDSRVWETPVHTPAPHATPGEGSVPREGTQEPVAWAVAGDYGEYAVALFADKESAQTEADRRALVGFRPDYVVVPLYRHPPVTKPLPKEKRAEVSAGPLAWAAIRENGQPLWLSYDRSGAEGMVNGMAEVIPLYRKPTLTDAERDDICVWLAECLRQASTATEGCNEELAERWQGRAKRAAAMIERLGGEG